MSFSAPNAYGIVRLEAKVLTYEDCGRKHHWLDLRFFDEFRRNTADQMTVHFDAVHLPKFQRLAALITETFGENPLTQEKKDEV